MLRRARAATAFAKTVTQVRGARDDSRTTEVICFALLAVLAPLAFGAAGAQAANEFLLLDPGKTFAEEKVISESFLGEQESELFRFIVTKGRTYELWCRGTSVTGTVYPTLLHAHFIFENCHTAEIFIKENHYYPLKTLEEDARICTVVNQTSDTNLKAVPVLHEKETFLLWEALEAGKPFAVVHYEGLACPWKQVEFTGTVVSKPLGLNEISQLFTFDPLTTLLFQAKGLPGDRLTHTGDRETYLEAALFKLHLIGPFFNKEWGAH